MPDSARSSTVSRRPLRLIHTSDIHVGMEHPAPEGGDEPRAIEALRRLASVVAEVDAHAVLIAGDLFDHQRLPQSQIQSTWDLLAAVDRPVIILPGNHDPYMAEGIYRRAAPPLPANVHLIRNADGDLLDFPDFDLLIWGRPHTSWDDYRPLVGCPPWSRTASDGRWRVAMAHGHWMRDATDQHHSYLIHDHELRTLDAHYVALGHWEMQQSIGPDDVVAYYSGSPCRTGAFTLVDLAESGVTVATVRPAESADDDRSESGR